MSNKMTKISRWGIAAAMMAMPLVSLATHIPGHVDVGGVVLPGGEGLTLGNIQGIIEDVATWLMVVGVIIAVIFIVWGGVRYMTAGGDSKKTEEAKSTIINGLIGAVVVLGVGVIIRTAAGLVTRTFFG